MAKKPAQGAKVKKPDMSVYQQKPYVNPGPSIKLQIAKKSPPKRKK